MFPGIVKMHREVNKSKNDELFIKNKFNRSDVTNMTSNIDSNFCYRNWFFTNDKLNIYAKNISCRRHFSKIYHK